MRRVVPALAVAMVLAGCTLLPTPDPAPGTVVHLEIHVPLGKGVTLIVDGEDAIAELSANDCAGQVHQLTTPTGRYLVVQIETGCTGSTTAGNGSHGYYAEPPGGTFEQVSTPAGPARIFSNTYYECTNSCAYGTDEVALVDVGGRIIQVSAVTSPSSGETTRSRPDLVRLLQGLRRT
ncbi:MAG TPA: hypothetical protein VGK18_05485 [Propionicimonas sp.]|uniref:hypothetical protein n=1 Tax=Propionicimonas sp. TaxID=1955623 RepID=UPI002F420D1A